MASKKAAPTSEELFAQLDELAGAPKDDAKPRKSTSSGTAVPSGPKSRPSSASNEPAAAATVVAADPVADLSSLVQDRPKSRPATPRTGATAVQSRRSGESTRSFHQSFTPADAEGNPAQNAAVAAAEAGAATSGEAGAGGGGSWWGGLVATASATASAAVKQAEALAKEIQKNEEAQKWAEQVKGNVGALRSYGTSSRLPSRHHHSHPVRKIS